MKKQNKLSLIIAYYLSRFDKSGYLKLGYKNFNEAVVDIGKILSVKATTVKNMRDEFDPYHDNVRKGWYQRELWGSRKMVIQTFENLEEEDIREMVIEILQNEDFRESGRCKSILSIFSDEEDKYSKKERVFTSRGITGKKAEEIFIEYYKKNKKPIEGELKDMRDFGCGYDFEIIKDGIKYCVEVKGNAKEMGGILFTSKEWKVAGKMQNKYYLALVVNVNSHYKVNIIKNPASRLHPKSNIIQTVRIEWSVSNRDINNLFN